MLGSISYFLVTWLIACTYLYLRVPDCSYLCLIAPLCPLVPTCTHEYLPVLALCSRWRRRHARISCLVYHSHKYTCTYFLAQHFLFLTFPNGHWVASAQNVDFLIMSTQRNHQYLGPTEIIFGMDLVRIRILTFWLLGFMFDLLGMPSPNLEPSRKHTQGSIAFPCPTIGSRFLKKNEVKKLDSWVNFLIYKFLIDCFRCFLCHYIR